MLIPSNYNQPVMFTTSILLYRYVMVWQTAQIPH